MWLLVALAASAAPCDAEALTERLSPGVIAAGERLGRSAAATELLATELSHLIARCPSEPELVEAVATCLQTARCDSDLVAARAELFLLTAPPRRWLDTQVVSEPQFDIRLPQALALTWAQHDAAAPVDLIGYQSLRVAVRPGPPPPPPPPPRSRRSHRSRPVETAPAAPLPGAVNTVVARSTWTVSCWGPDWMSGVVQDSCADLQPAQDISRREVALPSTQWAVVGPLHPDGQRFAMLTWPAHGVQLRLYTSTSEERVAQRAMSERINAVASNRDQWAVLACEPLWPSAETLARQVCATLRPATPQAVEHLIGDAYR